MKDIIWKPAAVTPHVIPKGKPYARITPNSITLNTVAANLIQNIEEYPWAEARVGVIDSEPVMLGFQFMKEQTPDAFPVKRHSKKHKGVTFFSRALARQYFGLSGSNAAVMQQGVEKIDDRTLAVTLPSVHSLKIRRMENTTVSVRSKVRK